MLVTVHVKPGARKNELVWLDDTTAKASITAVPEKGRANAAVIELLAEHYKIAKTRVRLLRGATTRIKQLSVERPLPTPSVGTTNTRCW